MSGWVGGWINEANFPKSRSSQVGGRVTLFHNSFLPQAKMLRGPEGEPADSQGQ